MHEMQVKMGDLLHTLLALFSIGCNEARIAFIVTQGSILLFDLHHKPGIPVSIGIFMIV